VSLRGGDNIDSEKCDRTAIDVLLNEMTLGLLQRNISMHCR